MTVAVPARHQLGQWFTPPAVADLALALALPRQRSGRFRLLDPSCGDGVFLARALAAGVEPGSITGVEISGPTAEAARARAPGTSVLHADLFDVELAPASFDVVVGNPPYVRQERLSAGHKQRIRATLAADWPNLDDGLLGRIAGRGDLAAACLLRALHFVRPGGRVALVVSSALLDAGYSEALWRAVQSRAQVETLLEAPAERWFSDAAVNTMIAVCRRVSGRATDPAARIARLRVPTRVAAERLARGAALEATAEVRSATASGQWSQALRAPQVWSRYVSLATPWLVPLAELAQLRRGVTSGANELFYLSRERAAAAGIEPEVLTPLVRAPRKRIGIEPQLTPDVAIVCRPNSVAGAWPKQPGAARYFRDRAAVAQRPTLRARDPWWALPARTAQLFMTKAYGERFVQQLCSAPALADQRVYALELRAEVELELLGAVLNSSYSSLALESLGRASMGEGALEWTVADARRLPVLDVRRIDPARAAAIRTALRTCLAVEVGAISQDSHRSHRVALDLAVAQAFGPALVELRDELVCGLVQATALRVGRARAPLA